MERKAINESLLFFQGGSGNSVALLHGKEAFLVDAKMALWSKEMQRELEGPWREPIPVDDAEKLVPRVVKRMLLTHAHVDHTGGLDNFKDVGAVLIHQRAHARLLAEGRHQEKGHPWVVIAEGVTLNLGGEKVRIFHPGIAHTDGDLVAYLPKRQVLISGDAFNTGYEPEAVPDDGGDISAIRGTLEAMLKTDFQRVLPGHGPEGTRAQVEAARDYLTLMEAEVRKALAAGWTEEQTVEQVKLSSVPNYAPIPIMANRALNVRMMYQALVKKNP